MGKALFEIPIYRCTPHFFFTQFEKDKQKHLGELFLRSGIPREQAPDTYAGSELRFEDQYGGPWQYNQVVGWLQLYVLGSQIRGEIWFVDAERIRRKMRNKRFCHYGKAFELDVEPEDTSAKIYEGVLSELKQLEEEKPFKGRYLDLEALCNIGPLINWRELVHQV
ncbi:MAG: hypothetical protein M5R40_09440 [Anaerolineae bacterium]|nr:hypothetical protein [Anaerolineae bacterium]